MNQKRGKKKTKDEPAEVLSTATVDGHSVPGGG